ncbi:MAG: GNAT family N-acetyltransferase [Nanoarchaeota archaeon]|nr:GNAT family N-acetyltransferase [Nanoarchaeota archaeon]
MEDTKIEQDILIEYPEAEELKQLISIYKEAFEKHNIFEKPKDEVEEYIKKSHASNVDFGGGFLVIKKKDKIIGGMLIRKTGGDLKGNHIIVKYNHVAISKEYTGKGYGKKMLEVADQKLKNLIKEQKVKSIKIELSVSENETGSLKFYQKCGFEIEGKLKSHYRFNELVYLLGKEIS